MSVESRLESYGQQYQLSLLKYFIENPSFYKSVKEYIKDEHITFDEANVIYAIIDDYYTNYNKVPGYDTVEQVIRTKYEHDILTKDLCLRAVNGIKNKEKKDKEFVENTAISFCQLQAGKQFLDEFTDFLEYYSQHSSETPDLSKVEKKFHEISKISIDRIDSDIVANMSQILSQKEIKRSVVPTGYPLIDYLLNGGFGATELTIIAAYSNIGKTNIAINFGALGFMQGKKILHFTFENEAEIVSKYYFSRIAQVPFKEVTQYDKFVKNKVMEYAQKGGLLHVKKYPMLRQKFSTIESYYDKLLDEGIEADLIIIDSPLHIKPDIQSDNKKYNVASLFGNTKGWAQEINKPVIATAQMNRLAAQEDLPTSDKIGDAIEIMQDCDTLFIASKGKKDSPERMNNIMKFLLAKNRTNRADITFNMKAYQNMCLYEEHETKTQLELMLKQDSEMVHTNMELMEKSVGEKIDYATGEILN